MKKSIREIVFRLTAAFAVMILFAVSVCAAEPFAVTGREASGTYLALPDVASYLSMDEAVVLLREKMKMREPQVRVMFRSAYHSEEIAKDLYETAIAHTGEPTEGDYIFYSGSGYTAGGTGFTVSGVYYYTIDYSFDFYNTYAEEYYLDGLCSSLLDSIIEDGMTDEEKLYAIHSYLRDHIEYDYSSGGMQKHTAYAALVEGKAVCQGYALLFYRLALACGFDCRIVTGVGNREDHAWNIVKLGQYYYNVDETWDSSLGKDQYFLKCSANFPDHTLDKEFQTPEFRHQYPMAATDYPIFEQTYGTLGRNTSWELSKDGTLVLSGSGTMDEFGELTGGTTFRRIAPPWEDVGETIRNIIVTGGVENIGFGLFYGEQELNDVTLLDGVRRIGSLVFADCTISGTMTLPATLTEYGELPFVNTVISDLRFADGVRRVDGSAFIGAEIDGWLSITRAG